MRLNDKRIWGLIALCGMGVANAQTAPVAQSSPPLPDGVTANGPAASSNASDVRYDEVGYAGVAGGAAAGMTATASGLAAGTYAEVTALDSGRTALVEISGGQSGDRLVDLSSGAAGLLGVADGAPVRVRQVQPADVDAVALREGRAASARLDSPDVLLVGLRARLKGKAPPAAASTPTAPAPAAMSSTPKPATPKPATPTPQPAAAKPKPAAAPRSGRFSVQVATMSTRARADKVAAAVKGSVHPAGRYFQVRTGPFADRAAANRARDEAAKRGYGDARVLTDD